jgi:hypothetical protein
MGGERKVQIVEGFWSMLLISSVYVSSSNDFLVAKHQGPREAEIGQGGLGVTASLRVNLETHLSTRNGLHTSRLH